MTWFFAGGMGPPPTGKQLRAWNSKKRAMKQRKAEEREAKKLRGGFFQRLKGMFAKSGGGTGGTTGGTHTSTGGSSHGTAEGTATHTAA